MQYCPETIIVHSAFSHVKRQLHNRSRSLRDLTKRECISSACETVSVVSGAIREATRGLEYRQSSDSPLFPYEISNLNYKLNAWIFKTWQRYREKSSGDRCVQHSKTQNDYFSCFPPLPHFNTAVYLSLVKDLGWSKIMIEVCLLNKRYLTKIGKLARFCHSRHHKRTGFVLPNSPIMHQSMLSPRVGGQGIPRGFDNILSREKGF